MPLLPIKVKTPVSEINTSIVTLGQVTASEIRVFADGNLVGEGGAIFGEVRITLDVALMAGQQITATQTFNGETSPSSEPVTVLAAPQELGHVVFGQVQGCAQCVGVSGVFPGATVEITSHSNGGETVRGAGIGSPIRLDPPAMPGEQLFFRQTSEVAGLAGPQSSTLAGTAPMSNLPAPSIDTPLRECERVITGTGTVPGARMTLFRDGEEISTSCISGSKFMLTTNALEQGQEVQARQAMIECEAISPMSAPVVVGPTEPVPPPVLAGTFAACAGATSLIFRDLRPGYQFRVLVDGESIGEGQVPFTTEFAFPVPPLPVGGTISGQQGLCDHWSVESNRATVIEQSAPIPAPILSGPLYDCASVVRVNAIKEVWVELFSQTLGGQIGEAFTYGSDWVDVPVTPLLMEGDTITARIVACGNMGIVSNAEVVQPMPAIAPPEIATAPYVLAYSPAIQVAGVVPGATVDVFVDGQWVGAKALGAETGFVPVSIQLEPAAPGEFPVRVAVRQRLCARVTELSQEAWVVHGPPSPYFIANPMSGDAPLQVAFTNLSTGEISSYRWFFAFPPDEEWVDQAPSAVTNSFGPQSIVENPIYLYATPGTYTVRLVAFGPPPLEFQRTVTREIQVHELVPPPPPPPPPPPEQAGVARFILYNCREYTITVWVIDHTAGASWMQVGSVASQWHGTSCPETGEPFVMDLLDDHMYEFRWLNPSAPGCDNNPLNGACNPGWLNTLLIGDENGDTVIATA